MAEEKEPLRVDNVTISAVLALQAGFMSDIFNALLDAKIIEPRVRDAAVLAAANRVSELCQHYRERDKPLADLLEQYHAAV